MATTNRVYILVAFFLSAIGAIFNIVSLGTEQWITGDATWVNDTTGTLNSVNYGLFQGNYIRMPFSTNYQLTMTCSFKNNICALLCGIDAEARKALLDDVYNNVAIETDPYSDCPQITKSTYYYYSKAFQARAIKADSSNYASHDSFINAGVWLCTLIFIILSALLGLYASGLALYNTVTNPIQYFLRIMQYLVNVVVSIMNSVLAFALTPNPRMAATDGSNECVRSLFYYNAAAFCCTVLYLTLWGTVYNITIFHNIGIYDTLVHNIDSDKRSFLGYSYWLSFLPLAFYCGSIGILYLREYLNARDPKQQRVDLDVTATDQSVFLF